MEKGSSFRIARGKSLADFYSPQFPTPRRSLFTANLLATEDDRRGEKATRSDNFASSLQVSQLMLRPRPYQPRRLRDT